MRLIVIAAVLIAALPALSQSIPDAALAEMERSIREHYKNRGLEIRDLKMFSQSINEASGFGKVYHKGRQIGAVRCEGLFNKDSGDTLAKCSE